VQDKGAAVPRAVLWNVPEAGPNSLTLAVRIEAHRRSLAVRMIGPWPGPSEWGGGAGGVDDGRGMRAPSARGGSE